jgi:predicted alpha/beta-hydrolase family hydrolase
MTKEQPEKCSIPFETSGLSAILQGPVAPDVGFVFAHGAGAGMDHAFMQTVAEGLATRGIATLRFQFPYMQQGRKRPDTPAVAQAAVRAAAAYARTRWPDSVLVAGGKSFGARMTSQAQAIAPLEGVRGLAFLGYPLHPAGTPSIERARHLADVHVPMLFLQGTKDKLAELSRLRSVVKSLGARAELRLLADADHSFHVPRRSGRTDAGTMQELLDVFAAWCREILERA